MRYVIGSASLLLGLLCLGSRPGVAFAHGGDSGGAQFPADVPGVTKEGVRAKEILLRLEKDPAALAVAKESIEDGKRALQRAHGANGAGDREGAFLLSRLALAHATSAEAIARAAASEKKSTAAETKAADLRDKLARTKTLLAETQAQRGQVAAELARADEESKSTSQKAQSKEDDRVQKGQKGSKSDSKKSDTKSDGTKKNDGGAPKTEDPKKGDPKKKSDPKKSSGQEKKP